MAAQKITLALNPRTVALLDADAVKLAIPKSEVVSRALEDFHLRSGAAVVHDAASNWAG